MAIIDHCIFCCARLDFQLPSLVNNKFSNTLHSESKPLLLPIQHLF